MGAYNVSGDSILLANLYTVGAESINQAYDVDGNALYDSTGVIVHNDSSTGTSTGYGLLSGLTGKTYVLRQLVNLRTASAYPDAFQSFIRDTTSNLFYKFMGSTNIEKFNADMTLNSSITVSDSGHDNDGAYYNGVFYLPDGSGKTLYTLNTSNNSVASSTISAIQDPSNGSTRLLCANCVYDTGKLYLVCTDRYTSELVHQTGDKLSVYSYDISSGTVTLLAELPWDCVYCQGCAYYGGMLYVTCNSPTTGSASNYTGITVKCIRTDTWALYDELTVSGNFEPEGMDTVPVTNGSQLTMGMGKYNVMSQVAYFTIPYELA